MTLKEFLHAYQAENNAVDEIETEKYRIKLYKPTDSLLRECEFSECLDSNKDCYIPRYLDGFMDCNMLIELNPESRSRMLTMLESQGLKIDGTIELPSSPWYVDRIVAK